MELNTVLAGKYKDREIKYSHRGNYAVIKNWDAEDDVLLTAGRIKEINVVDQFVHSQSKALTGTLLYGTGGAAMTKNINEAILEITWKTDEKSLIKVSKDTHERIMIGMYENFTPEEEKQFIKKKYKKIEREPEQIFSDETHEIMKCVFLGLLIGGAIIALLEAIF